MSAETLSPGNPVNELRSPKIGKDKKIVIPDRQPQQIRNIHKRYWDSDISNRQMRAVVQSLIDGSPCWNPDEMAAAGLGDCCNVNWGYGKRAVWRKLQPYVQALNSMRVLMNIKTSYGSPTERERNERIMSQKHRTVMRAWRPFRFRYLYQALYCITHGVSFAWFKDQHDWRWHVSTLGDMVVDRQAKADTSEFDIISTEIDFAPGDLFEEIIRSDVRSDKKKSNWTRGNAGWHIPTVERVIAQVSDKEFFKSDDSELSQRLWKAQETYFANGSKVCTCILMLVREYDGSYTQYIVPKKALENGNKREHFMFKAEQHYRTMDEAVVVFVRDIGTNGYFHSIRGTGNSIFNVARKMEEMKNRMFDALTIELSIPVKATEEVMNSGLAFVKAGPFWVQQEGVDPQTRQNPNYTRSAFPLFQLLNRDFLDNQGIAGGGDVHPGTKMDFDSALTEDMGGIDMMEYTLWIDSFERLMRESLRRMRDTKTDSVPGGKEAMLWKRLCMEEGVPEKAIDGIMIDECRAERAIGNGSQASRMFSMGQLKEMLPFMDDEGRNNAVRDYIGALPGVDETHIGRWVPEKEGMRPDQQVRNAMYENSLLMFGGQVEVLPNDDHLSHLDEHSKPMVEILQAVEQGQMDEAQAVRPLYPLYMHANEHLKQAGENPLMKKKVGEFQKAIHNMGEIITNGQRKLKAQMIKAAENQKKGLNPDGSKPSEGQAPERAPFNGLTADEFAKFVKAQIDLQHARQSSAQSEELHRMTMAQKAEQLRQIRQGRSLKNLEAAVKFAAVNQDQ